MKRILALAVIGVLVVSSSGCTYIGVAAGVGAALFSSSSKSKNTTFTQPAPTLASVTPSSGSHSGGTVVTLTGTNFTADSTVAIGGVAATNVVVSSTTQITATVPRSSTAAAADVSVTTAKGGTATLTNGFTYTADVPSVTIASIPSTVSHNVVFGITVSETESDPANLLVELGSNGTFKAIPSTQFVSGLLNDVPTSPTGVLTNITWNSDVMFPSQNASNLQIRVTATSTVSGKAGTPVVSGTFSIVNNTPPTVTITQPAKASFDLAIVYDVTDVNGFRVNVTSLTWSNVNAGTSGPLTVKSGQGLGSCPASAGGSRVTTVWDSLADIGYGNNQLVTVSVTISNGVFSASATTNPFFVSNGPISDQTLYKQPALNPKGLCVGDVTGDGLPDLIVTGQAGATLSFQGTLISLNTNLGQTFAQPVNLRPPFNTGITAAASVIAVSSASSSNVYAGIAGLGIQFTSGGGTATPTWANTKLPFPNPTCIAQNPLFPAVMYVGAYGLAGTNTGGVYITQNGGSSWLGPVLAGTPADGAIGAVAVDPNRASPPTTSLVLAGTASKGLFVSTNGGGTWTQTTFPAGPISCMALDPSTGVAGTSASKVFYVGTLGSGLYVTTNGAAGPFVKTKLPNPFVRGIAIDPNSANASGLKTVYAATHGGVFASTDGGATWSSNTLGTPLCHALAMIPVAASTPVLYAGTKGGGIFESTDGAVTWTAINSGLTDLNVFSLATDVKTPANVYAGTQSGKLFLSTNSGGTWTEVTSNLATAIAPANFPIPPDKNQLLFFQQENVYAIPCATLDTNGDGLQDLVAAEDVIPPLNQVFNLPPIYQSTAIPLATVLLDYPNDFANCTAHQSTLVAPQSAGTLSMATSTYQSAQATLANVAPLQRLAFQSATTFKPATTGNPLFDALGWFPQAVVSADLDAAPHACSITATGGVATVTENAHGRLTGQAIYVTGSALFKGGPYTITVVDANTYTFATAVSGGPQSGFASVDGGSTDLVMVQALRQSGAALLGDNRGCVVVRQVDPATTKLGATWCLDPTDMGKIPTAAAVADLLSSSRTTALVNPTAPVGSPDIVVVNTGDDSLTFYLQYAPAAPPAPPTYVSLNLPLKNVPLPTPVTFPANDPISVATGDVNGDGANDFVVVGQASATALVFIYDANPASPNSLLPLTNGLLPFRVSNVLTLPGIQSGQSVIANLTATPARNTIVVSNGRTNDVSLFVPDPKTTAGATPSFTEKRFTADLTNLLVVAADLNNDGRADLAVMNTAGVDLSIYYQTAPGTLDSAFTPVATGLAPLFLTVGDLTGAGAGSELVVPNFGDSSLWVMGRNPSLGLAPIQKYDLTDLSGVTLAQPTTVAQPVATSLGTLGGKPSVAVSLEYAQQAGVSLAGQDLITTNPLAAKVTNVLTGAGGNGFFNAVGDVNGDGIPDLVVAEFTQTGSGKGGVGVFLGQANGTFVYQKIATQFSSVAGVYVADVDGDGHNDLVYIEPAPQINILYGPWTGAGLATPPAKVTIPVAATNVLEYAAIGDLSQHAARGEPWRDIVTTGPNTNSVVVFYQTAARTFSAVQLASGNDPEQPVIGDLNGDGLPDIALCWAQDNKLAVYYQQATPQATGSTFAGPLTFATDAFPEGCAIMDVDSDGKNDVVVAARGANALNIFFQR